MKLYATVTSERASKGQGGNKYLEIVLLGESKEELAHIKLFPKTEENIYCLRLGARGLKEPLFFSIKGEGISEKDARVIQNFGEQHPQFHSKRMNEWRAKNRRGKTRLLDKNAEEVWIETKGKRQKGEYISKNCSDPTQGHEWCLELDKCKCACHKNDPNDSTSMLEIG